MLTPSRLLLSVRPTATPALLVAAASIALHFAASPFLIPAIANHYDVALGTAGYISVAQVAGFTVVNLGAGRRLRPRRTFLAGAAVAGVLANALSATLPAFLLLLAMRFAAGAAAGLITWLAWTEAMRDRSALRDVAGIGPLAAFVGSPLVAWLSGAGDLAVVFLALAATCAPAALMGTSFDETELPGRRRMSPSRSNVVLLGALGILTGAGSSLFIFAAAIGHDQVALSPVTASLAFSLNAVAGFAATRRRPEAQWASAWLAAIVACAVAVAFTSDALVYLAAMALWGFAFWKAVPTVLESVAAWSLVPEERTGDAQAIMALGRAAGPILGGALLGVGSYRAVGVGAATGLAISALLVALVDRYRARYPERRPAEVLQAVRRKVGVRPSEGAARVR